MEEMDIIIELKHWIEKGIGSINRKIQQKDRECELIELLRLNEKCSTLKMVLGKIEEFERAE